MKKTNKSLILVLLSLLGTCNIMAFEKNTNPYSNLNNVINDLNMKSKNRSKPEKKQNKFIKWYSSLPLRGKVGIPVFGTLGLGAIIAGGCVLMSDYNLKPPKELFFNDPKCWFPLGRLCGRYLNTGEKDFLEDENPTLITFTEAAPLTSKEEKQFFSKRRAYLKKQSVNRINVWKCKGAVLGVDKKTGGRARYEANDMILTLFNWDNTPYYGVAFRDYYGEIHCHCMKKAT